MEKRKVLIVSQAISPYFEQEPISTVTRSLSQGIIEQGMPIRTFMPKFGFINERKHQLHEVIRLSGMNLIIDESDHPLLIKVASIQSVRLQVYFIDNEVFFKRKSLFLDESEKFMPDNGERMVFFCRGVIETVRKLGWAPDIVHCFGWFTSLIPLYIKKSFREDFVFSNSRVAYSIYNDPFPGTLERGFTRKLQHEGVGEGEASKLNDPTYLNLVKTAVDYSDGVVIGERGVSAEIKKYVADSQKLTMQHITSDNITGAYLDFYDELPMEESALAE